MQGACPADFRGADHSRNEAAWFYSGVQQARTSFQTIQNNCGNWREVTAFAEKRLCTRNFLVELNSFLSYVFRSGKKELRPPNSLLGATLYLGLANHKLVGLHTFGIQVGTELLVGPLFQALDRGSKQVIRDCPCS